MVTELNEENNNESNNVRHAKKEFSILKEINKNDSEELTLLDYFEKDILELLNVLSSQDDSNNSIGIKLNLFKKIVLFDILSPLQGDEQEWFSFDLQDETVQNNRVSSVFKNKNCRAYYLDAVVFNDIIAPNGYLKFTGSAISYDGKKIKSRQYIKSFPFVPKTFYLDIEVRNKDTDLENNYIIDSEQNRKTLEEIKEYYDFDYSDQVK